jgi:hypothetical protein
VNGSSISRTHSSFRDAVRFMTGTSLPEEPGSLRSPGGRCLSNMPGRFGVPCRTRTLRRIVVGARVDIVVLGKHHRVMSTLVAGREAFRADGVPTMPV